MTLATVLIIRVPRSYHVAIRVEYIPSDSLRAKVSQEYSHWHVSSAEPMISPQISYLSLPAPTPLPYSYETNACRAFRKRNSPKLKFVCMWCILYFYTVLNGRVWSPGRENSQTKSGTSEGGGFVFALRPPTPPVLPPSDTLRHGQKKALQLCLSYARRVGNIAVLLKGHS